MINFELINFELLNLSGICYDKIGMVGREIGWSSGWGGGSGSWWESWVQYGDNRTYTIDTKNLIVNNAHN